MDIIVEINDTTEVIAQVDGIGNAIGTLTNAVRLTGILSPAQITGNQNDYNPTSLDSTSICRLSSDASRNITGMAGGIAGRTIFVHNVGAQDIVLKDETTSSATNRFALTADLTLSPDSVAILQYDGTTGRWRAVSGGGGGGVTDADFLVKTSHAGLSAERVVTDTTTITWDWATAGQAKANFAGTTTNVAEGSNLYYTAARVSSYLAGGTNTAGFTTTGLISAPGYDVKTGGSLYFWETDNTNTIGLKAPTLANDFLWILPADVPVAGEVLKVTSYGAPNITLEWGTGGGSGTVNSGTQYQLTYYAATGTAVSGLSNLITDASGVLSHAASARTSGTPTFYHRILTPADTTLTASVESVGIQFGGDASAATVIRQYATGALALHRENLFVAPTIAFVAASTSTENYTVEIKGAPIAGSFATLTTTANLGLRRDAIAVTSSPALIIANHTAAAAGAQQMSGGLDFLGYGWKTTATAASQEVRSRIELLPVQGAANPTAQLKFGFDINATGTFTNRFILDSDGKITLNSTSNTATITSSNTFWRITSGTDFVGGDNGTLRISGGTFVSAEINAVPKITIAATSITFVDAFNLIVNATTGTKIATATSQKLGFWNAAPIIQPVGAGQAAVVTTASTQTTPFGYTTAAQADAIVTLVNQLRSDLVAAGLIKGAA